MKKTKKKLLIALTAGVVPLTALIVVIVWLATAGFGGKRPGEYEFEFGGVQVAEASSLTLDEGSEIDGKREEDFWNDNTLSFTETKTGVEVTTWAHLGENGLYLFTETNDSSVYSSTEKQFYENDSVEYYIDPRPYHSLELNTLKEGNRVRTDNIQLRVDAAGRYETWFGRETDGSYPWVAGYFPVLVAAHVNGELNQQDKASGYCVEAFIPWSALGYESKPEEIGVMPAFNNVSNREDTSRSWFSVKGMSHAVPTSYARVDKDGFVQPDVTAPKKTLTADAKDKAYSGSAVTLTEVSGANTNPEKRGELKAFLGDDGVYFQAVVQDKVLTNGLEDIWSNDGIELLIDTVGANGDSCFQDGILRVAADIDGGTETDICLTGYNDYVPVRRPVFVKTSVSDHSGKSMYGYEKTYVYEIMVPYQSMGLAGKPEKIAFAWAVKTPNETAYIYNRRDGGGQMEGQDWLWTDRHYPQNPSEYYPLTADGITADYVFPAWTAWKDLKIRSDAQTRYDYRGWAKDDGLYLNMVQYVDSYAYGGVGGTWKDITHVEMELWNGDVGYGWDGTYLAFFPDGSYYINSVVNVTDLKCRSTITDRGKNYSGGYRYEISYEIYVGFANNAGSADGPYAYVKMMSLTPGESTKGYENAVTISKDKGERTLWTDDCNSYEFRETGIVAKDDGKTSGDITEDYQFPKWTPWENCAVRSDAPNRFDYRGWAKDDGLYLNMVQYVDSYVQGGVSGTWADITHVEMELWNGDVGYGWDGTYLAFFPDGSYYINNMANVTDIKYRLTVTDRGTDCADGYRYELSYEIYLGFSNNAGSADGPYAFVKMMNLTPGESSKGYENAVTVSKDGGERILWTEESKSVEFRESGVVGKDSKYNTSPYEAKIEQYKKDWKEKGRDGKTTIFIGDSFFDGEFWSKFYELYEDKDVLRCGVSSSTSYDWEIFTASFLSETAPKNIVMHIGTNNIYDDRDDAYTATSALQKLFSYMHETLPTTNLYYFGITRRTYDDAKIAIANEVNAAMEQWCAQRDYITFIGGTVDRLTGDKLRDNVHPREDDECNAYEIFVEELAKTDIEIEAKYPVWTAWEKCTVRSKAQGRYDYRGFAADDGLYINMVQYVNSYVQGGVSGTWADITHVEMELWNGDVGYGWGGTYLAFFPDGSYYINNTTNVTDIKYRLTVTDRGADYADGYRYELSYEICLGFANNTANPEDGPYAYVQFMSYTPGETTEGYENSVTIEKDGSRTLWTDNCKSYEFRRAGIVGRDDTPIYTDADPADDESAWTPFY